MKRVGNLIPEIISKENLEESINYVLRGNKRKTLREVKNIIKNKSKIIKSLQESISTGSFSISSFREIKIKEREKERLIQVVPFYERIGLNAIMKVVEEKLYKTFITDTAASLKNRGLHYLFKRIKKDMINNPQGTRFIYKCDIKKFYQNIDQDLMFFVIKCFIKDKTVLKILERCIKLLPKGLSIGLRSSQLFGNLYLSYFLDHHIKDKLGIKYYRRYCDDIVVQAGSYKELTFIKNEIHKCINNCKLSIKPNEQMWDIKNRDLDFLGYRIFWGGKIKVRNRTKKTFIKKWNRVKSKKRKESLLGSFLGMAKHSHYKKFLKINNISL